LTATQFRYRVRHVVALARDAVSSKTSSLASPPRAVRVGDQIRFFGQEWTVAAIYPHPLIGEFFRLERGEGEWDLISARGHDGNYELLSA